MPVAWSLPLLPSIKTNTHIQPPIQDTDHCGEQVLTTKWLKPDESIARLEPIIAKIKKARTDTSVRILGVANPITGVSVSADTAKQTGLMFLDILLLLLASHLLAVKHLNSIQSPRIMQKLIGKENITCDIPWDETLGLPSHPTLAADAKSFPKIFRPEDQRLTALCESFSGWSLYATQKELCACNSRLKVNELTIEILVNHILKTEGDKLLIKQLIGLRSKDLSRLEKHYYEDKVPSRFVDSLLIISDVSADIFLPDANVRTNRTTSSPEQFKIDKFQAQIASIVGAFFQKEFAGKEKG